MSGKFKWGSSEDESGNESHRSGPVSLNGYLEKNFNFNDVTETIPMAFNRMMLVDLRNLKTLLESESVVIKDVDRQNLINDELSKIISKRENKILENERKSQLVPSRRRKNTRGDIYRQTNSEGDDPKLVESRDGSKRNQNGIGGGSKRNENGIGDGSKRVQNGIDNSSKLTQDGADDFSKLVQIGVGPKHNGPKAESKRRVGDSSNNGPKPRVSQYTQTDPSEDQNIRNISEQMEHLAGVSFQGRFLGGAKAHDMDGVILTMGEYIVDTSTFFAGYAVDEYSHTLLVTNHSVLMKLGNATWSGIVETRDEQNAIRLLKAHYPITLEENGPEEYIAKSMIGKTFRLMGGVKSWMRGKNRFGRPIDLQVQLKKLELKVALDDLGVYALIAVGAL